MKNLLTKYIVWTVDRIFSPYVLLSNVCVIVSLLVYSVQFEIVVPPPETQFRQEIHP